MAREIERDGAAALGEGRLGKHPAVQIGAETVNQQYRDSFAAAEIEDTETAATCLDVARRRGGVLGSDVARRLGRDKAGDEVVDLGIRHAGGRRYGEQRADRQGRAGRSDDAAQGAALGGLEDIGDLAGLDLQQLLALLEAVALAL